MIGAMLAIVIGILVANFFFMYIIYYFVNRNWENLLDIKNQINALDMTIYHSRRRTDDR